MGMAIFLYACLPGPSGYPRYWHMIHVRTSQLSPRICQSGATEIHIPSPSGLLSSEGASLGPATSAALEETDGPDSAGAFGHSLSSDQLDLALLMISLCGSTDLFVFLGKKWGLSHSTKEFWLNISMKYFLFVYLPGRKCAVIERKHVGLEIMLELGIL